MATQLPDTPPNDFTQGFGLPLEYQSELEALQRRRQLAQMLAQQSMAQQGTQMAGPIAIQQGPLANIAKLLTTFVANKADTNAQAESKTLAQRAFGEGQTELQNLQGMPTQQARIAAALASRFPGIRGMGSTWQNQQSKAVEKAAEVLGANGQPGVAVDALANNTVPTSASIPPPPEPKVITAPGLPTPFVQTKDTKGQYGIHFPNMGSSVEVKLPGKEGELALTRDSEELKARKDAAAAAMSNIATAQRLTDLYQQGLKTGGGAGVIQGARKVAQAFGVDMPETGMTDSARTLLGERILDRAKSLGANPSDADREAIKQIVGGIDTDPNAVGSLLAWMTGKSLKTLQDYNEFVAIKRQTARADHLYDTADVGIRAPTALFGPKGLQMRTIQALQQEGGDVTKYQDPTGQQIPADAQFQFGTNAAIAPNPPSSPQGDGTLSPELQKRLEELRKKHGLQ